MGDRHIAHAVYRLLPVGTRHEARVVALVAANAACLRLSARRAVNMAGFRAGVHTPESVANSRSQFRVRAVGSLKSERQFLQRLGLAREPVEPAEPRHFL